MNMELRRITLARFTFRFDNTIASALHVTKLKCSKIKKIPIQIDNMLAIICNLYYIFIYIIYFKYYILTGVRSNQQHVQMLRVKIKKILNILRFYSTTHAFTIQYRHQF